jgi:hypothetical protein
MTAEQYKLEMHQNINPFKIVGNLGGTINLHPYLGYQ